MPAKKERDALRRSFLQQLEPTKNLWVFAYGSLIWNPAFRYVDRRHARIYGHHRAFCIWLTFGRATREIPGLMMGLERGGSCNGVLFCIPSSEIEAETEVIWDREMLIPMYKTSLIPVKVGLQEFRALTFVVDRSAESYSGRLPLEQQAIHIALARGEIGGCADYLFSLTHSLELEGIRDRNIEQLLYYVKAQTLGHRIEI